MFNRGSCHEARQSNGGLNAFTLNWGLGLGVAVGGALASLLTSMASVEIGRTLSPPVVGETDGH